jgi:hypothetical protein
LVYAWVVGALLLTAVGVVVYGVGQQAARRAVDDVPRALLEQARDRLSAGVAPATAVGGPTVDLSTSGAPFLLVYDSGHHLVASTATIAGAVPNLPPGVLDDAVARGEDRVSWQPRANVREAVVATPWRSPTAQRVVVAGASLAATETRTGALRDRVGVGWLLAELGLTAAVALAAARRVRADTSASVPD